MIVIGLTGSIAMGKSEVAKIFRSQSIPVFDADQEVHALYDSPEGAKLLLPLAPDAIVDGHVDRQRLSRIVVEDPQQLIQLEKTVHAEIARRRKKFTIRAEHAGHPIVVVDVPLLFEKSGETDVDVTIVVSAPLDKQRQRALARPGMTAEKLDMILKRQMPDAEKQARANHVIYNTGSMEDLQMHALAVLTAIQKEHRL